MYTLKLIKGLSCKAGKVHATKENPLCKVKEKNDVDIAIASGYFKIVDEVVEEDNLTLISEKNISKMTIDECKDFARQNNIDISGLSKIADLRKKILEEISDIPKHELDFDLEYEE